MQHHNFASETGSISENSVKFANYY